MSFCAEPVDKKAMYAEVGRRKAAEQQEQPICEEGAPHAQLLPYQLPPFPYPASSHIRSLMPRSSGGRRSYGRNWQSRASCPGMCARHRPGSLALPHQRPNLGPRTSLSGPSMTSGTQTVSDSALLQMGMTGVGGCPYCTLSTSVASKGMFCRCWQTSNMESEVFRAILSCLWGSLPSLQSPPFVKSCRVVV